MKKRTYTAEELRAIFFNRGVLMALMLAYKNPSLVGYDTPSQEWSDLQDAYEVVEREVP